MPYSIMLDAGHGGRDPGAVYKERKEKDDTLRLTLAVGEILEAHGWMCSTPVRQMCMNLLIRRQWKQTMQE